MSLPDELETLNEHWLPPLIRRIAAHCGKATALKILAEYGGVHLCVPAKPSKEHRLTELLGPLGAADFCRAFGRETLDVPKGQGALLKLRLIAMRERRKANATYAQIAREFGLTEKRVSDLLKDEPRSRPAAAAENADLFGFDPS
jgi:hypothetical protein